MNNKPSLNCSVAPRGRKCGAEKRGGGGGGGARHRGWDGVCKREGVFNCQWTKAGRESVENSRAEWMVPWEMGGGRGSVFKRRAADGAANEQAVTFCVYSPPSVHPRTVCCYTQIIK